MDQLIATIGITASVTGLVVGFVSYWLGAKSADQDLAVLKHDLARSESQHTEAVEALNEYSIRIEHYKETITGLTAENERLTDQRDLARLRVSILRNVLVEPSETGHPVYDSLVQ